MTDPDDAPQGVIPLFEGFRAANVVETSPLYEHLTDAVIEQPALAAALLAAPPTERLPLLLFASVHFLLRTAATDGDAALAAYYPSLGGTRPPDADLTAAFRDFVSRRDAELRALTSTCVTQTNEARRAAMLRPALAAAQRRAGDRGIALVEVGCSSGLMLLADRYGYRYGRRPGEGEGQGLAERGSSAAATGGPAGSQWSDCGESAGSQRSDSAGPAGLLRSGSGGPAGPQRSAVSAVSSGSSGSAARDRAPASGSRGASTISFGVPPVPELMLEAEIRGAADLPGWLATPLRVVARVGIDRNPICAGDADQVDWLRACVWPEHLDRLARLEAALAVARDARLDLRRGDLLDLLPAAVAEAPPDAVVVVVSSHVLPYLAPADRRRFAELVAELAETRDLMLALNEDHRVSRVFGVRAPGDAGYVASSLVDFTASGGPTATAFAKVDPHGSWLEWL